MKTIGIKVDAGNGVLYPEFKVAGYAVIKDGKVVYVMADDEGNRVNEAFACARVLGGRLEYLVLGGEPG